MDGKVFEGKDYMRICIFADLHGNAESLNRMLEVEYGVVDRFIFAGDIFGYFYGQSEIIDRFMSFPDLIATKGNHEKYYLTEDTKESLINKYGSSYESSLSEVQRKYVEVLPEYAETFIDGKLIGIFHGGPEDYLEQRIYPDSSFVTEYYGKKYDYLIVAHTHYRLLRKLNSVTVINPGSLGQPRDGKGFSYCLLDTEKDTYEFKTVEVNIGSLLSQVKDRDADKYVCEYLVKKYR